MTADDDRRALFDEYAEHGRRLQADVLEAALHDMQAQAEWSDMSWDSAPAVVRRIRAAIEQHQPFSMVRVGDGTGNLVGYRDPAFARLREHSLRQILTMTFGTADFTEQEVERIRDGLIRAVRSADVLGVSDYFRLGRLRIIDQESLDQADLRGYSGSRESYVALADLLRREGVRPPCLVTNHMHRFIAPHMAEVLSGVDRVCVIGPYDLGSRIHSRFGVGSVVTRLIPNQDSSSGGGRRWFPDDFDTLHDGIDPARDGRVYLVAAGLLAKPLCARIKERGGVALDVGSLIDVWAGRGVRKYHDGDFLTAHSL